MIISWVVRCSKHDRGVNFTQATIDPRCLLKWLFSGHCMQCWFQPRIQESDHMMMNISWNGCSQFAEQLWQNPQK